MYDLIIIGGGPAAVSCALILGSAKNKPFVIDKKIAIITHQKSSDLQNALFNNAYGIAPGTLGSNLLQTSIDYLANSYPHIEQLENQKVHTIEGNYPHFKIISNKDSFEAKEIVVAIGHSNTFDINGLNQYVMPHQKALPSKNRIQLQNQDHLVDKGIYVAGTLAGWRSQLVIATGSGASVATDIMTRWNDNIPSQSHDAINK